MADPGDAGSRTLTVLGCDGSYPGPGGAASGYLVRGAGTAVWVDAGSGTFANLQRWCDPATLDAVIVTHEHPDHWSDLESFAVFAQYFAELSGIAVYAPSGLRALTHDPDLEAFDWHVAEPGERAVIGGLAVTFSRTDHPPPTLAVRFDDLSGPADAAQALAYTADSGPGWSVAELGRGIGTVLSEASYTADHEGRFAHLSGRQAGSMAADAEVARLVVTHRWPTVAADALADEASTAFGSPVVQARTGLVVGW